MTQHLLHHYSTSGEFINTAPARLDPRETEVAKAPRYLQPARSTTVKPPRKRKGFVRVFDKTAGEWAQVEDHRGKPVWNGRGRPAVVDGLGPLPDGVTQTEPAETADEKTAHLNTGIKAEAARRIVTVANLATQVQIALLGTQLALKAASASLTPDQADKANGLEQFIAFVEAVAVAKRALLQSPVVNFADDAHWPSPGAAAQRLVDRF